MTQVEQIVRYAQRIGFGDISLEARHKLKSHILDSIGCALAALDAPPIRAIRKEQDESGCTGPCTLIGGGSANAERAAFYNTALAGYLDYNDAFLAAGESCRPSLNLGAILAACELVDGSGRDFLTALAIAYHVQCRLTAAMPVQRSGFDDVTQQAYSVAAGVSRMLRLSRPEAMNALGMAGAGALGLAVARTGRVSHWKFLAPAQAAASALSAVRLAQKKLTGPAEAMEGKMGLEDALRSKIRVDWIQEKAEAVLACNLKRYNGNLLAQSCIAAVLELRSIMGVEPSEIHAVRVGIFQSAYDAIGGGAWGRRDQVTTKEQAEESLPYLAAVAFLDGQVEAPQFAPARVKSGDVQELLTRVRVQPMRSYTRRFPGEMPCHVEVTLRDGRVIGREKADYPGFNRRPMSWDDAAAKFERLAGPKTPVETLRRIQSAVAGLEYLKIRDLTTLLRETPKP